MKLEICTTGKTFGKICLKTITDTFFRYVIPRQERDGISHDEKRGEVNFVVGSDMQQKFCKQ